MPEPKSCSGGNPVARSAAVVTTSTGLVTMRYVASGATSRRRGSSRWVRATVLSASSIRL